MKYSIKINTMIMDAMKEGEKFKSETYKALKNEFLKLVTAKGAKYTNINEIPDAEEIRIINKMIKERNESADIYEKNGRKDLALPERFEAEHLQALVPQAASVSDINNAIIKYVEEYGDFDQKKMGLVIKYVKEQFDNVDGGLVAGQVKAYLNGHE